MRVIVDNDQADLLLKTDQIEEIVNCLLELENEQFDEVGIHFVSEEAISLLHAQYFDDPTPTDCISFPMENEENTPYRLMGDLFVCPQVAKLYAKNHNLNPYEETTLYVVHGLLHLLGYRDQSAEEIALMRQKEKEAMTLLQKKGLTLQS